MEEQKARMGGRRRQRRRSKNGKSKGVAEPVLIAARRPDSPRLEAGPRNVIASAQPKAAKSAPSNRSSGGTSGGGAERNEAARLDAGASRREGRGDGASRDPRGVDSAKGQSDPLASNGSGSGSAGSGSAGVGAAGVGAAGNGAGNGAHQATNGAAHDGAAATGRPEPKRRVARIVQVSRDASDRDAREQQLLERLVRSQGRSAISRAADDLLQSQFVPPKEQEVQIQLLEHEDERKAREAVFALAELLQKESPIKRPVLDQRLRRLEQSAEDPITRDAAGALRRSMRVHHGA